MRHYMVGISGFSGTGKDTVADRLIKKYDAVRIGLADPAKRHMADLYGFTEDQLFGPSEKRNAGDLRYPKYQHKFELHRLEKFSHVGDLVNGVLNHEKKYHYFSSVDDLLYSLPYEVVSGKKIYYVEDGDPNFWLSPREALQKYCELMNNMYLDTWIKKSIETQVQIAREWEISYYSNMGGILDRATPALKREYVFTCSPDFRHKHEIKLLRECSGDNIIPVVIRVKRPSIPNPPYQHRSEIEQTTIPDSEFDFVINNNCSINELNAKIDEIVKCIVG